MKHHTSIEYRFAPIPEGLLTDPAVDHLAVRLWGVLARFGMDPDSCYPSHKVLAERLHVSARSIARPIKALEDAGWLTVVERHTARGDRTSNGYRLHVERAPERAPHAEERVPPHAPERVPPTRVSALKESQEKESHIERETLFPTPLAPEPNKATKAKARAEREPRENELAAREITNTAWAQLDPKPATPWPGVVQIVERLLDAGHAPDAVGAAMLKVPTISTRAMELELNRNGRRRAPAKAAAVDVERRSLPSGRVQV